MWDCFGGKGVNGWTSAWIDPSHTYANQSSHRHHHHLHPNTLHDSPPFISSAKLLLRDNHHNEISEDRVRASGASTLGFSLSFFGSILGWGSGALGAWLFAFFFPRCLALWFALPCRRGLIRVRWMDGWTLSPP